MNNDDTLHTRLTAETLETYFASPQEVSLKVFDGPECRLLIDGSRDRIQLLTPKAGVLPDVTSMRRLDVDLETMENGDWFVLTADAAGARFEAYSVLAAVVEDIAAGSSFTQAVSSSVSTYRELLSNRARLSSEKQLGLLGELHVLRHLVGSIGEHDALTAWVGPGSEEHDFVLSDVDLEVKTTMSESRRHMIGSEKQLQRSGSQDLWLVSVQVTAGGVADQAFSLNSLIDDLAKRLDDRTAFEDGLESVGYRHADRDLYTASYVMRSTPRAFIVDDDFPCITRTMIDQQVPNPALVGAVSYRVDLTGMNHGTPPAPVDGFVEGQ